MAEKKDKAAQPEKLTGTLTVTVPDVTMEQLTQIRSMLLELTSDFPGSRVNLLVAQPPSYPRLR